MSIYCKALDVIGSCQTRAQLRVAAKYLSLAEKYLDSYSVTLLNWSLRDRMRQLSIGSI